MERQPRRFREGVNDVQGRLSLRSFDQPLLRPRNDKIQSLLESNGFTYYISAAREDRAKKANRIRSQRRGEAALLQGQTDAVDSSSTMTDTSDDSR